MSEQIVVYTLCYLIVGICGLIGYHLEPKQNIHINNYVIVLLWPLLLLCGISFLVLRKLIKPIGGSHWN